MPVISGSPIYHSVDQLFSGRTGTAFDAYGDRRYVQRYRVIVKVNDAAEVMVCSAPGLPLPWSIYFTSNGAAYEYDTYALMIKMSAEQELQDDWQSWIVTCEYSTKVPPGGRPEIPGYPAGGTAGGGLDVGGGAANNPDLEPPEISWTFESLKEAVQYDLDGFVIQNRANQPILYEDEIFYPIFNLTRNELFFDQFTASKYAGAVNEDIFLGSPPDTAQVLPPQADMKFFGSIRYYRVAYKIRFAPLYDAERTFTIAGKAINDPTQDVVRKQRTWQPLILNQGTMRRRLVGPDKGKAVPILKNGQPINNPVLLDNNGQELTPDANGRMFPIYLEFRTRRRVNFASLFRQGYIP